MDALAEVAGALVKGGPIELPITIERSGWLDDGFDAALLRADAVARREAPAGPPPFDAAAARWGLGRIAHLAHRIVDREATVEEVATELAEQRLTGMPLRSDASHVWSVDLALRHLASIERAARGLRSTDPLRGEIRILARHWPLSSASLPSTEDAGSEAPDLADCIRGHPTLRRMYLDRVAAAKSLAHARIPWVREALSADLGRTPDWIPH